MGLDVSGSVDGAEYLLQVRGLAAALEDPDVRRALLATPGMPVHLAVFEWSEVDFQRMLIGWTAIASAEVLAVVTARLRAVARVESPPGTAVGAAMQFGADLLDQRGTCWKRTLDLSGDGKHNLGPHPRDVQAALAPRGLTINALVIGADGARGGTGQPEAEIGELTSYFRTYVLVGPDAFVETALGFDNYRAAMVRKLKRELEGLAVSWLDRL